MLIRPLELCWNPYQKGFSVMSFAFPDDSYYSLFAIVRLSDVKQWWLSFAFFGWLIGVEDDNKDS